MGVEPKWAVCLLAYQSILFLLISRLSPLLNY
jgi:hypothetical protein